MNPRLTSIQSVAPLALRVLFSDQTSAVIDFEPVLAGKRLGPLRVEAEFIQAAITADGAALVWPNGATFSADRLYRWADHLAELKQEARRGLKQELKDEWAAVQYAHGVLAECGPFVSLAEGARHGGLSLSTLSTAVSDGRFPALRTATGLLVRLTAVDKRVGLHAGPGRPRKPRKKQSALASPIP
ncbi:MAG: DUF2442 domain-containing protein [Anaerolineales bacterium]|nr:DUF2442 domain-containing protein [Anaerolineales bacterium]